MLPEVQALVDGGRDAVRRVIIDLREKADSAERLRAAEHRAFMAEQREVMATMQRDIADRLAAIRDGIDGKDGAHGRDGIDGKDGAPGRDGADGLPGAPGEPGRPGADGKDGAMGEPGRDGAPGRDGVNGVDGTNGRDGLTAEDVDVTLMEDGRTLRLAFAKDDTEYGFQVPFAVPLDRGDYSAGQTYEPADMVTFAGRMWIAERKTSAAPETEQSGWRLAVDRGADGSDGAPGKDAYAGEARGLFDAEAQYLKNDTVTFNGSEWRAKSDAPGDLPGDGWVLSASRGKRGDRGERGEAGRTGERGQPGAEIIAGYADDKNLAIIFTKENGDEIKVDMYDLADRIRNA